MTTTFLLGSGFSKALSPNHMPVMAELSAAVQAELASNGQPPIPGADTPLAADFERWLSYLIETPPWISDGWQMRNAGAFADIASAVHRVLCARQDAATQDAPPDWLEPLVGYWERMGANVITFNYDQLIEAAWITSPYRRTPSSTYNLYPVAIAPIGMRVSGVFGPNPATGGLTLLKLHGSLNWYYSGPGGPPGDPVYDAGLTGAWGAGLSIGSPDWEHLRSDKHPLIVPPAAVKSPYYGNAVLRSLWRQAADAVARAREIVIVGFSFPPTDQLVASLLATSLRESTALTVLDPDPSVEDRLRRIVASPTDGPRTRSIKQVAGDTPIATWVADQADPGPRLRSPD